jgi:hypothetical protein
MKSILEEDEEKERSKGSGQILHKFKTKDRWNFF